MQDVGCPPDLALRFFREFVEPTVADFLRRPDDRRLGLLACLVLSSMADHFFHARHGMGANRSDRAAFRQALRQEHYGFGLLADIANATKHLATDKAGVSMEDVQARKITMGNLRAGWPMCGRAVMIEEAGRPVWLLTQMVGSVHEMWRGKLGLPHDVAT